MQIIIPICIIILSPFLIWAASELEWRIRRWIGWKPRNEQNK